MVVSISDGMSVSINDCMSEPSTEDSLIDSEGRFGHMCHGMYKNGEQFAVEGPNG